MEQDRKTVAVVGAGLVGCLTAIMMAKLGWRVDIYEARDDLRQRASTSRARSINLAYSARGIEAVRAVDPDLVQRLIKGVIPMKGRMVHAVDGSQTSQLYGINGECINAIDRELMNKYLLDEADAHPNVSLRFNTKLLRADFDGQKLTFEAPDGDRFERTAHLTIGADGAYSKVREQTMRVVRMHFEQDYIDDAYMELSMPAGRDPSTGEPKPLLDPHHLHIWPRHSFMLIALPNTDMSFTCTLFAPFSTFDSLPPPHTPDQERAVLEFFRSHFPDAMPHFGDEEIVRCFKEHPRGSLITIKAQPYHYRDRAIIIGDAAHSMVPFYGQGMNCGFEDVRVLRSLLLSHSVSATTSLASENDGALAAALEEYSNSRHEDLLAISRLTKRNYVEMRSSVATVGYKTRKWLDGSLAKLLRGRWLPLYTMVTFREDVRYSEAESRDARQTRIVERTLVLGGLGFAASAAVVGLRAWQAWSRR